MSGSNLDGSNQLGIQNVDEMMSQPILHIVQAAPENNNIMKTIWQAFNYWIQCPKDEQKIIYSTLNNLYNIFQIEDDVVDNSKLRKGIPTAHLIYGIPLTIHSIMFETIVEFEKLLDLSENKEIFADFFIKAMMELVISQGIEIHFRENFICPTYEDYEQRVLGKWLGQLKLGVGLLQLSGNGNKINFSKALLEKISLFIQIYNDYINLHNAKYSRVKGFCEDLEEGKFSFPIIHAILTHPDDHRVLNLLKKRPKDADTKRHFVSLLESFGSFEYTRQTLKKLKDEVLQEVAQLEMDKNPYLEKILDDVLNNLETELYCDDCDATS